jgi:hypothetical protein
MPILSPMKRCECGNKATRVYKGDACCDRCYDWEKDNPSDWGVEWTCISGRRDDRGLNKYAETYRVALREW